MRDFWRGTWFGICLGLGLAAMLWVIWDSLWAR
jgi:hypothetical protein